MPRPNRHSRTPGILFLRLGLIAVWALLIRPNLCAAQCIGHAKLNAFERRQFIEVAFSDRSEVYAQYLSQPGCGRQMIARLQRLGARIGYADDRSGYALVSVSRATVLDSLDIPGISYAYTLNDRRLYDEDSAAKVPSRERKTQGLPPITIPYPRVATEIRDDGPYFTHDEIGLTELWKQNPTADGRGVRVGVVDEGFDLLHPALQQARDAQGNPVPKIADIGTLTTTDEDSSWVQLDDVVQTHSAHFDAAGRTWTAPAEGTYRFGVFRRDLVLGPEGNSHTQKLTIAVGVLWSELANRVWVDTDGDGSFANQRALGEYAKTHDVDWFGTKTSDADNRIPFGVHIDASRDAVYVRIGGMHGAYIAGALAGNRVTGGLFTGAAPCAQLIDQNADRATLLAAVVQMFARPDVDVVNFSGGIGRGDYPPPDEGMEEFAQHVIERAAKVYDKPFAAYSAAPGSIQVNDYAGPEMLRRNRQVGGPYKETTNSYVSWLQDGMVNTVVAPSASLETESRYMPIDNVWEDGERRSFGPDRFEPLAPDGYAIGDNNSPAIPVVSGILADLISGARHENIRYNANRLNNAIFTGARLLADIPVSQQGYGLVSADSSWQQLVKMARADDPANPELTSFTLSQMKNERLMAVRGFQEAITTSDGILSGEIWITRHGGHAGFRQYSFSLRGNDGTFILVTSRATLAVEKTIAIRFQLSASPGWHVAFLELRDEAADVVMEDVPLSVRVAEKPESTDPGVDRYRATIAPLRSDYRYVDVKNDVQAVRYVMKIPYTGAEMISTRSFPGFDYDVKAQPPGNPVDLIHHIGPLETLESFAANDSPGIQEVFWENRGRPEYATKHDDPVPDAAINAEFEVHKYGLRIARTAERMLSLTNRLAAVEGRVEFFSATVATWGIGGRGLHAIAETNQILPGGLAQWRVRILGETGEHTYAYLLDCTGKRGCRVVTDTVLSREAGLLAVQEPAAGTWKIVIRSPKHRAASDQSYELTDARLKLIASAEEQEQTHASGESWALPIPDNTAYAAFRVYGTKGVSSEGNGLLIGLTPLVTNVP